MDTTMKILIAYDGLDCADAALHDLQRAGLPREAEAIVMSVAEAWLPPPPPSSYEIVESAFVEDPTRASLFRKLRQLVLFLRPAGGVVIAELI